MTGTWEFIKRHKGKIIAGGVLIGGAAAYVLQIKQQTVTSELKDSYAQDNLLIQERRRYIFDTNQRACDQTIADLVKELKTRVQLRFDVDAVINKLREDPELPVEVKVELWNKIKVLSIARIIGVAYSYSLLTVTLKAQISILAAEVCAQFEHPSPPKFLESLSNIKTQFVTLLRWDSTSSASDSHSTGAVAANRKVFVQCTQYLLTTGIAKLLNFVESTCKDVTSSLLLTDEVTSDKMRDVFDAVDKVIAKRDSSFFTDMIAPLTDSELLTRLVKSVESEKCRRTLTSLVDFYLTAAAHKMPRDAVVLAKLLPSASEIFDFIASDAYDSPLQNSLCSSDIYQYANFVFKTP